MLLRIYQNRSTADVVLIDTYSTSAFYFAWLSARLCRLLGLKYVCVLNGGNLPSRLKNSPTLSKGMFNNAFVNIAVSSYLHEAMLDNGYRSIIIENSIELYKYPYRKRAAIHPKILWVRALHETYNPEMAVKVISEIAKTYPDVTLTMVGPDIDGSMEKCKQLVADFELHEQVVFTGKLSKKEWVGMAQQFDLFINTTNFDNLPVSVLEAMALGMPVVSTNAGGLPYLITHEKNGLLVGKGSVTEMVNCIKRLLVDTQLTSTISMNARKKAEEYDWLNIKDKWQQLFDEVVA